ncbi:MAG: sigma-70 family RNA polymerase sigma factor [Planctomycetota bacterium]
MDGPRQSPTTETLALEARRGSVQAFEELVARHEAALFRFLFQRTRDTGAAEDLVQEAFLRAWQKLELYDPRWRFSTWLYTIASNLSVSAHRTRGREPELEEREHEPLGPAREPDPAQVAAQNDEGRALWDFAALVLREEERSALWLRYAEERSMDEIGAILGRPAVTTRVMLFRARARLAEALAEAGATPHSRSPLALGTFASALAAPPQGGST